MRVFVSSLCVIVALLITPPPLHAQQIKEHVGVWDFDLGGGVSTDVKIPLSDELRSELFLTGKFVVVERNAMGRILEEQEFQQTECISTECIIEVGQLLGVEKMVAGSIGKIGSTYTVHLWLIDIETGKIEQIAREICKCEVDELIVTVRNATTRIVAIGDEGRTASRKMGNVKGDLSAKTERNISSLEKHVSEKLAPAKLSIQWVYGYGIPDKHRFKHGRKTEAIRVHDVFIDDTLLASYALGNFGGRTMYYGEVNPGKHKVRIVWKRFLQKKDYEALCICTFPAGANVMLKTTDFEAKW